jgi:hypothetical protein
MVPIRESIFLSLLAIVWFSLAGLSLAGVVSRDDLNKGFLSVAHTSSYWEKDRQWQ